MPQKHLNLVQLEWKCFVRFSVLVVFALFLGCLSAPTFAQQPGQRTFASAEEAASALFAAMQVRDEQVPLSILGPAGKDVTPSGDRWKIRILAPASSSNTRRCIGS